jgi:Xaa-Pro aminopeptidase
MARLKRSVKDMGKIAGAIVDQTIGDIDFSLRITRADFRQRWAAVQAALKAKGYDLGYACGSELDRTDVAWLTGFYDPIVERYAVIVPAEGKPILLAGCEGNHVIQQSAEISGADTTVLREFGLSDEEYVHVKCDTFKDVVKGLKVGRNARVAIFSVGEFLPHDQHQMLVETFGKPNVRFECEMLQHIKYVKSLKELRVMQEANKVTDAAFRAMLAVTAPGATETQVAGVGDFVMKALGAHRSGFPTIVTSGSRQYSVIGPAADKVIEKGDIVSLGLSPTWHGYHGIVRRTVRAGEDFTARQREFVEAVEGLHNTVWHALEAAAAKNLPANTVDAVGKAYLARTRLQNLKGEWVRLKEPYSYVHNAGCSEAQEGFGAITSKSTDPLGERLSLMIDCALIGFIKHGTPLFPCVYAVVENSIWRNGKACGMYNTIPINAQELVGNEKPITQKNRNPFYRELK